MKKCIEIVKTKFKNFFLIDGSYKTTKITLLAVFIVTVFAYNKVFSSPVANPDGLVEGFYYYNNANWASAGCGRWLIRYFNLAHLNIVSPVVTLIEYMLFTWLTAIVIIKVLKIKKTYQAVLFTLLFSVTPTVITHLSYTCVAAPYACGCFLASLFVYFNLKNNKIGFIFGSICLSLSLGCYQSYVGLAAVLSLMTISTMIAEKQESKEILTIVCKLVISAIAGALLYLLLFNIDLKLFGLEAVERAGQFSISQIFTSFPKKITESYSSYFVNFVDDILKHKLVYALFICVVVFTGLIETISLIKNKEKARAVLFLVSILLIPVASNLIGILVPYNGVNLLMSQQNWLLFAYELCLIERMGLSIKKTFDVLVSLIMVYLIWTYSICANATFACYELSYKYNNSELGMALERIYDLDDYHKDETKIVMVGFPDETNLRNSNSIYRYGIHLNDNLVFWTDLWGSTGCREKYFINMFGVNPRELDYDEYYSVIVSEEFKEMPCWPEKGSISMINKFAVIKFTNEPLYPY